ncbi:MAG: hypothetical protein LBV75_06165 [Paludibacter sp.]|nr:hypothetical protein [Paludibacter sp.]
MKYLYYILIISSITLYSCSTADDKSCRETEKVQMHINFFDTVYNAASGKVSEKQLYIDSLTIQGIGSDSLLYENKKNLHEIFLPLKKNENSTQFVILFNQTADTITIQHLNSNYFISLACGCEIVQNIENVTFTHNYIDSLQIINPAINLLDVKNIKIYHF